MAKARLFDLPETKGLFQLKGVVTGTEKDGFYKEKKTKTQKDFRMINFGVEFSKGKTMYVTMQGMPQDNVYFFKKVKKGEKSEILKVNWADRHTFKREGFKLIGNNIGVTKTVDEKGNQVNDKKTLTDFDSCKLIGDNLKDGNSVFLKGKIEFSSFTTDSGDKKNNTKFVPNQVSLCADINFDDEKFQPAHDFSQTIIFMGIEQEKENEKATGRFVLSAKVVTYSTIEDVEFIISDAKLAQVFKKNLKDYTAIEVWGKLDSTTQTETVETDDIWGESNEMEKLNAPTKRELVITGAKKTSIDTDTYAKDLVEAAIVKINNAKNATQDYADTSSSNDGWGDTSGLSGADDTEDPWN